MTQEACQVGIGTQMAKDFKNWILCLFQVHIPHRQQHCGYDCQILDHEKGLNRHVARFEYFLPGVIMELKSLLSCILGGRKVRHRTF